MTAPNDITKRADEIKDLIASDKLGEAIKLLLGFTRDFSEDKEDVNEVIVISQTYNHLSKQERRGTLSFEDASEQRRKLLYQILDIIDSIIEFISFKLAS